MVGNRERGRVEVWRLSSHALIVYRGYVQALWFGSGCLARVARRCRVSRGFGTFIGARGMALGVYHVGKQGMSLLPCACGRGAVVQSLVEAHAFRARVVRSEIRVGRRMEVAVDKWTRRFVRLSSLAMYACRKPR